MHGAVSTTTLSTFDKVNEIYTFLLLSPCFPQTPTPPAWGRCGTEAGVGRFRGRKGRPRISRRPPFVEETQRLASNPALRNKIQIYVPSDDQSRLLNPSYIYIYKKHSPSFLYHPVPSTESLSCLSFAAQIRGYTADGTPPPPYSYGHTATAIHGRAIPPLHRCAPFN